MAIGCEQKPPRENAFVCGSDGVAAGRKANVNNRNVVKRKAICVPLDPLSGLLLASDENLQSKNLSKNCVGLLAGNWKDLPRLSTERCCVVGSHEI